MNRRQFLQGIAGITASGLVLPGEEQVRRFWRGWTAPSRAGTLLVPESEIPAFASLSPYDMVFMLENRATGDGHFAWWTGKEFIRQIGGMYGRVRPAEPEAIAAVQDGIGWEPMAHGFPVFDAARYAITGAPGNHSLPIVEDRTPMNPVWVNAMTDEPQARGGRLMPR